MRATLSTNGYTFTGWNTQAGGKGQAYAPGTKWAANGTLTLYAQWTAGEASLTYDGKLEVHGGALCHVFLLYSDDVRRRGAFQRHQGRHDLGGAGDEHPPAAVLVIQHLPGVQIVIPPTNL